MLGFNSDNTPTDYLDYLVWATKKKRGITDRHICELHRQIIPEIDPDALFVRDFLYLNAISLDIIERMPEDELRSRLALAELGKAG
jgi:hypothetical protein